MIWGLAAIALFAAAGLGLTHRLDRSAHGPLLLAESVLVGGGLAAAAFALHRALVIPFIVWSVLSHPPIAFRTSKAGLAAAALQIPILVWHAAFATRSDLYDWTNWLISRRDFFFIWGYKARLIFEAHGIPWTFLTSLPNDFTHPDYPLLVPLQFAVPSILARSWQPQAIGLLDTALAGAAITVAYYCLREVISPALAAWGALALAGCALLPWPGFADGPLVAYSASAALLLRTRRSEPLAAALLCLTAMTKNEGIAFVAATGLALLLTEPRRLRVLLAPGLVIMLWLSVRRNMPTDLFTPGLVARVAHNLPLFPKAFANIGTSQPFVWIVALAALLFAARANIHRERFLLIVAALQLAFYLAAYAVTPLDLIGHVNGSWDRISSHVTMLVAFAGITSIGNALRLPAPE